MRVICCLFVLTFAVVTPAYAADDVGLSVDGSRWASSLHTPLFDQHFRWIPGDDETASFYVRNQGPSRALLTIAVRSADTDELLANDDIALRARVAPGAWVDLDNGVPSASLTEQSIARGGVVRVDVNAVFDPASTNRSQTKQMTLALDVTLTDSRQAAAGQDLPGTGSGLGSWLPTAAVVLLVLGAGLVRRQKAVDHG